MWRVGKRENQCGGGGGGFRVHHTLLRHLSSQLTSSTTFVFWGGGVRKAHAAPGKEEMDKAQDKHFELRCTLRA